MDQQRSMHQFLMAEMSQTLDAETQLEILELLECNLRTWRSIFLKKPIFKTTHTQLFQYISAKEAVDRIKSVLKPDEE